ncbi:MAG TPA: type II toxin-antitoxin system VapC family toxin [Candidatus Kapabacteria bacterium]|nr:type II toxin-antitoxin system VapC family toxin [Candidatus Kapabacteria bacterium]HPO63402.1 type II toxin-antitoxin system VapC family toxin [Candidatus Kapabacteria bacterium]
MHKLRIYIDTSVIGGCFDEEFAEWSNKLFDEFIDGKKIAVISEVVVEELSKASNNIQNRINDIDSSNLEIIFRNNEVDLLAFQYIECGAITTKYKEDALHIALATYYNVDVLVSWNFKHIVNLNRILKYNSVNLSNGYKIIEIRTPKEVISNEERF